jgi:hypothetical protein
MLLAHTFRAFRHRDYAIFWSGLFLGHTGTLIQTTAQSWLIFQLIRHFIWARRFLPKVAV